MYAMCLTEPGQLGLVEIERATDTTPPLDSVRVRFRAGGICGSDKPGFLRGHPPDCMVRPGYPLHECIGTVLSTSDSDLVGRRVVAIPDQEDGMREEYTAPAEKVYPLASSVEQLPDEIAVLTQPLATVLAGADTLGDVYRDTAVVLGLGPIGLLFGHVLRQRGARRVIGVDIRNRSGCPLTTYFDEIHQSPDQIRRTVDITVEAVGHQQATISDAITLTRPRGRILAFGVPDDDDYLLPYQAFFTKSLTLTASVQPAWQKYLSTAETYLVDHQPELSTLVTHTYPVTEAQAAFTTAYGVDGQNATAGKVTLLDSARDR